MKTPETTHVEVQQLIELFKEKGSLLSLSRSEILYHQSQNPNAVYFLKTGLVSLVIVSPSGKERLVRIFKPLQFIGHRAALAGEPYHATAKALESSSIYALNLKDFDFFLTQHPSVLRYFVKILAQDLKRSEVTLSVANDSSVSQKVAETLVYLLDQYPEHQWTRQEIAEFIGSSTPTVFRVLAFFEEKGWVQTDRRKITIKNKAALLTQVE